MIARVVGCIAFATLWGCYSPSYIDCEVTCESGKGCPSGLTCDTTMNACRQPGMVGACGVTGDGGNGDGMVPDAACTTWAGLPPSNFKPCDSTFPPATSVLDIVAGHRAFFDTSALTVTVDGMATPVGALNNGIWVVHYLTVTMNDELVITGTGGAPLLIVADGAIMINSTIDGTMAIPMEAGDCVQPNGSANASAGGGGGGGGYGGAGASGGGAGPPVEAGEAANGVPSLVPLRFGCSGGVGGTPNTGPNGGVGGSPGAAFELASAVSITTVEGTSTLRAGGGGGGGGNAISGASSGGGGGGTGGSILLEAPILTILGAVCAPGGGGGQGGGAATMGGGGGTAVCGGGLGGLGSSGGDGGNGAGGNAPTAGASGSSAGGGGGGVGRIHFHYKSGELTTGPDAIVPPPL